MTSIADHFVQGVKAFRIPLSRIRNSTLFHPKPPSIIHYQGTEIHLNIPRFRQPDKKSQVKVCPRRLLDTRSLRLVDFNELRTVPPYAILSHRHIHGQEASYREFLTYADIQSIGLEEKSGYRKIRKACSIAQEIGLDYLWVDTCCIDQTNRGEVARNIRSMFDYYRNSAVCLLYLFDVVEQQSWIQKSECFERGWTLLELVAPLETLVFDQDWKFWGPKINLIYPKFDSKLNLMPMDMFVSKRPLSLPKVDVMKRLTWVRGRKTTRPHDLAYSLTGLFEIRLEVDYDEPVERTFHRFQEALGQKYPELLEPPSRLEVEHGPDGGGDVLQKGREHFMKAQPELLPGSRLELTWLFLAAGHLIPPISSSFWPSRGSDLVITS